MMKKEYIRPELEITEFENEDIITGSNDDRELDPQPIGGGAS